MQHFLIICALFFFFGPVNNSFLLHLFAVIKMQRIWIKNTAALGKAMEKHAIGKCVKQTASECQRAVQIYPIFRPQPHPRIFFRALALTKCQRKAKSERKCLHFVPPTFVCAWDSVWLGNPLSSEPPSQPSFSSPASFSRIFSALLSRLSRTRGVCTCVYVWL